MEQVYNRISVAALLFPPESLEWKTLQEEQKDLKM
jgi:hypothetical protein